LNDFAPLFIGFPGGTLELDAKIAGAKAAELSRMARIGLDVPPAFVLPTTLCAAVNRGEADALNALAAGMREGMARLEEITGRRFGDERSPLLVSVRSGAAISMPGMLSTVLDVGANSDSVRGLIRRTGNPRLAWDCYARFLRMFSEVVTGAPADAFSACIEGMIRTEDVTGESDLDPEALERLAHQFASLAPNVPNDPFEQLTAAARAVYLSWEGERAREYRRLNRLDHLAGTAVTVQVMVFGNAGFDSGAGVAFSRNPATGAKELYVDFLFDAQGEDVVSGRRIPSDAGLLAARLPQAAEALSQGAARMEREFGDVQDIEFTIENGKLYFLQTRAAKRTARAALRVLIDFVAEGIIDRKTALARFAEIDLEQACSTHFAHDAPPIATAAAAAPGVASGRAVFDTARAKKLAASGLPVILVTHDIATEDIGGMAVADGLLTAVGSRTAHAAVVARQLGKVCLVGCHDLRVEKSRRRATIAANALEDGDWLSLDGNTGAVSLGRREIVSEPPKAELAEIESWRSKN
jgi:pyruvate,orthophosphate dikinase